MSIATPRRDPANIDEFNLVADSAPVPIWVTRLDRKRAFVNRAYADFLAMPYAEAIDFDWRHILHPDDQARIVAESIAGEATLQPFSLTARYRRHDGAWRWMHSVSQPRWDAAGNHIGFIGVAHDITEAKEAEEAVREREAQLAAFVSQTTAGLGQVDLDGRFTLVNDRFCEITGRSREDLLQLTMQAITHPDDLARNVPLFERAVREGTPYTHEKRYLRPDGSHVWVNNSVAVIRRPDGAPYGVLAVALDVTERRAAEEALRKSEESIRLAVEGAGMATWEIDLDTLDGQWSPNRFDLLGYPRAPDGRGRFADWLARIYPEDLEMAQGAALRCFRHGDPFTIEYRILRADSGEVRWLQSNGSRIDYDDGRPSRFVGVSFDITARKNAEIHQALLIDELNHRVKNTLAIVQGIAQQTIRDGGDVAAMRETFESRLSALSVAHNMLTREQWTAVSLATVIRGAVAPHGGDNGLFTLEGPDVAIQPKTAISLALAIHELATNAVKHGALSQSGGRVAIDWCVAEQEGARGLLLTWQESGGPDVTAPAHRGFGTRMIERGLAAELAGTVKIHFDSQGVRCVVEAPLQGVA